MSNTNKLREALTRQNIKWKRERPHKDSNTKWQDKYGYNIRAQSEYTWDGNERSDKLLVYHEPAYLTIPQIMELTMGRMTCHDTDENPNNFTCSECGASSFVMANDTYTTILADGKTTLKQLKFCPNCGCEITE